MRSNRGKAFGFHRAADTAGAVVGPLIGLALYQLVGQQFGPLLWIAVIPALVSVALVFFIRERPHPTIGIKQAWSLDGLPRRYYLVPADNRGTALGIQAAVSGVGLLIAGVWAGLAWNDTGHTPFIISGVITAVLAVGLLASRHLIDGSDEVPATN